MMRSNFIKRFLPSVLALCLLLSPLSFSVSAGVDPDHAFVIGENSYATLQEAIDAAQPDDIIELKKDVNFTTASTVTIINKSITFDLTNGNLTIFKSAGLALEVKNSTVHLTGGGYLDVQGGIGLEASFNAYITVRNVTGHQADGVRALYGANVTVLGDVKGYDRGVYADSWYTIDRSTVIVKGSVMPVAGTSAFIGVQATDTATVTVDGSVTGHRYGVYAYDNAAITVKGDVTAAGYVDGGIPSSVGAYSASHSTVTIDGSLTGDIFAVVGMPPTAREASDKAAGDPNPGYDTYIPEETFDSSVVLVKKTGVSETDVCSIGGQGYAALDLALAAVPLGTATTIDILTDINHAGAVQLINKNIILNLNGHTVTISTTVTAATALIVYGGSLSLTGGGELNISGKSQGVHVQNNGVATVTNAKVSNPPLTTGNAATANTGGVLTVLGDAVAEGDHDCAVLAGSGGSVTVNGNARAVQTAAYAGPIVGGGSKPTVHIKGNAIVTGTHADSAGAFVFGGGEITIDGEITVADLNKYIRLNNTYKTKEETSATPVKAGYLTYSDGTGTYSNTVWVKDTASSPNPAHTVTATAAALTPIAGDPNVITLTVKDSSGNTDTTFTGAHDVTLSGAQVMAGGSGCGSFYSFSIPASGTLTTPVVFTNGVATPSLSLFKAGAQTISFSIAGATDPTASVNLTVAPRPPATMTLTQDITAPAVNGGQFAQQPKLELKDSYANLCTNDSTTQVTVSKNDAGNWALTGTATVTAVNGVVTFTDLGATNTAQVTGAELKFAANVSVNEYVSAAVTLPAPVTYLVTVQGGTGGGNFAESVTVNITAETAPTGKAFDKWTTSDGVTFANANAASTSFVMPGKAVTVTATYKDLPPDTYVINVQNDGHGTANASATSAAAGTEITLTATPNSGYRFKQWQVVEGGVTIIDSKFAMPAGTVTVKAIFEKIPDEVSEYKITDGANSSWKMDTSGGAKIICDGEFSKFTGVKVDGSLISAAKYTAVSGSTVITLKPEYLATLPVGTHTVEIVYTDGSVTTNLTVMAAGTTDKPAEIPQTGDSSMTMLYVLMLLSGAGILSTALYGKKRRTAK